MKTETVRREFFFFAFLLWAEQSVTKFAVNDYFEPKAVLVFRSK
jgi:hypothetical protein